MIIWTGLGFLVAVITFGACLLANLIFDRQFGAGFYSSHAWAIGAALMLGGSISCGVGFLLKGRTGRAVIDERTGERLVIDNSSHSFFFLPMHWAGLVIALIGASIAIGDLLS